MSSLVSQSPLRNTDPRALPHRDQASLVATLHQAVAKLVSQPAGSRPAGAAEPVVGPLHVRSLRRKPGRGMVAVYGSTRSHSPSLTLVTATVAEEAMSSPELPRLLAVHPPEAWRGQWPGIVHSPIAGVSVQAFPADAELPALAAAVDMTAGSPLHAVLSDLAGDLTGDPNAQLASADVEVIRYRPGARCVLRYRVTTEATFLEAPLNGAHRHVLFGKFYRHPSAALAAHGLAERLWHVTTPGGPAYLPRPLGVVLDLALVLTEAAGGRQAGAAIAGKTLLRPAAGAAAQDALQTAAQALAWWHSADVDPGTRVARTAITESRRAQARIELLAAAVPGLDGLDRMGDELLTALAGADCKRQRLVHGAFRPNQLVFTGPSRAAITDLDGAGAGDPAVDVGGFCAALRPPGWWHGRADQGAWWDAASATFTDRYFVAMIRAGAAPAEVTATLRRASLFEASSILKIAGHRSRRLSSGRPREVVAMVSEAGRCVARYKSGRGDR